MNVKRIEQMTADQLAAVLFGRQQGAASDRQLRGSGFSWEKQQRMISNNLWRRHSPGVILLVGSPATWHQRAMAATLATSGALLSGAAAARLHRLDGFADAKTLQIVIPVDVMTDRGGRRDSLVAEVDQGRQVRGRRHPRNHSAGYLAPSAGRRSRLREGVGLGFASARAAAMLKQTFERWQIGDVTGSATHLLRLLDDRIGQRLPRSWFQRLSHRLFDTERIHFVDEWPVHDATGKLVAELDLADIDLAVGVEWQSIEFHTSPADVARDVQRRRALRKLGWDIVEIWWSDLDRMDEALADVRFALARARKLQG